MSLFLYLSYISLGRDFWKIAAKIKGLGKNIKWKRWPFKGVAHRKGECKSSARNDIGGHK